MFWPPFLFNLCVGLLFAAYLLRAVRRYERRADAVMAKLDQWEAEELRKYDRARDEIKASMRAQINAAIEGMQARSINQQPRRVLAVRTGDGQLDFQLQPGDTIRFTHAGEAQPTDGATEEEIRALPPAEGERP